MRLNVLHFERMKTTAGKARWEINLVSKVGIGRMEVLSGPL